MSIRIPLTTVLDYNDSGNVGATSIVNKTFFIPQDTDQVMVKVPVASIVGGDPIVNVFFQTTDDGGTTWYDLANLRLPNTTAGSILGNNNATARWVNIPTTRAANSVVSAQASSLGANQVSGLPVMSQLNRISIQYLGTITTNNGVQVQVKTGQQSATA